MSRGITVYFPEFKKPPLSRSRTNCSIPPTVVPSRRNFSIRNTPLRRCVAQTFLIRSVPSIHLPCYLPPVRCSRYLGLFGLMACLTAFSVVGLTPIPQLFQQEIATNVSGLGQPGADSLLDRAPSGAVRAYSGNQWWEYRDRSWQKLTGFSADTEGKLTIPDPSGKPFALAFGATEVLQILRKDNRLWVCRAHAVDEIVNGTTRSLGWPEASRIFQIAVDRSGTVWAASSAGLFRLQSAG